jgi:hypothetical protein
MDKEEIIEGLRELIKDRESFFNGYDEWDEQFRYDADVLTCAIRLLEAQAKEILALDKRIASLEDRLANTREQAKEIAQLEEWLYYS